MSARRSSPMGDRAPANAALRGGLLIAAAVAIGVALMSWGFADEGGLVEAGTDTTTTTAPPDELDPDDTTETTAPGGTETAEPALPEARPPEETTVLVVNASGVDGAAGRVRDQLLALNYTVRSPETAPERTPDTVIYYLEGWRPEALQIATDLNIADPTVVVMEMPVPPPMGVVLGDATSVLIILGEDGLIAAAGA